MEKIIFILAILLFIPSLVFASVSCPTCTTSSCSCTITDCSSGKLLVYSTSTCSGVASDKGPFSSGTITWYPSSEGTFYAMPFCDNSSIAANCSSISVSQPSPSPTTTTTTTQLGGGGCRALLHVCTAFSVCCPGLQCVDGLCRTSLNVTTPTTIITTIIPKEDCSFECCHDEENYYDKECEEGFECIENECKEIEFVSPPVQPEFPWGLILPIILIVILVPLFVFFFIFRKKQDQWKNLYEKWKRPKTRYQRF